MNGKNSRSLRVQRIVLTVLCVVLGVILAAMIAVTAYGSRMLSQLNYVDSGQPTVTLPSEEISTMDSETEPVLQGFTVPVIEAVDVDFGTSPQLQIGGGEIVNILLVGSDADDDTGSRSDAMILCTFNKAKDTITMTSFLRDLYVEIPGHKKDRINAAYAFGGTKLLCETLYENFDVEVDGCVLVDFGHFEEVIDCLGGVTLELTNAEARFIKKHIPGSAVSAGSNLLSGAEALAYARNRNDVDGDFSRTNRQRKLLRALVEEYKGKRLTDMLRVLNELVSMITTDISKKDLTAFAVTLFPMLDQAQINTQSIPVADGFRYAKIDGKSVLVPDMEKNRQVIADMMTK